MLSCTGECIEGDEWEILVVTLAVGLMMITGINAFLSHKKKRVVPKGKAEQETTVAQQYGGENMAGVGFNTCKVQVYLVDEERTEEVLVDTGACRTMMPESWVTRSIKKYGRRVLSGVKLIGAGGGVIKRDPHATTIKLQLKRGGKSYVAQSVIGEGDRCIPLIGTDFWEREGAVINFRNRTIIKDRGRRRTVLHNIRGQ